MGENFDTRRMNTNYVDANDRGMTKVLPHTKQEGWPRSWMENIICFCAVRDSKCW